MHSRQATQKVTSDINRKHFSDDNHYFDPNSTMYKNLFKDWPQYTPVQSVMNGLDCVRYEDALKAQIEKSKKDKFYFCTKK